MDRLAQEREDTKRMLKFFLKLIAANTIIRDLHTKFTDGVNHKFLIKKKIRAGRKMGRMMHAYLQKKGKDNKVRIRNTLR